MKKLFKKTFIFVGALAFVATAVTVSYAADFKLHPQGGYVQYPDEFYVDVLIDAPDEKVTLARAVLLFDPSLVEVEDVSVNNGIFSKYPTDSQIVDNTNGVIQIEGFSQTGALYSTDADSSAQGGDVFARLKFKTLYPDKLVLEWKYDGQDTPHNTVIMRNGSPPENILKTKPSNIEIIIQNPNAYIPPTADNQPNTSVVDGAIYTAVGILAIAVIVFTLLLIWGGLLSKRVKEGVGTIVIVDDK